MPGISVYKCGRCGSERELVPKSFFFSPLPPYPLSRQAETAWAAAHLISFVCDVDEFELILPRKISAADWARWSSSEKAGRLLSRFSFLASIYAHIQRHVLASPESEIDYGTLGCPYCGMHLECKDGLTVACIHCGHGLMVFDGGGVATLNCDWPPSVAPRDGRTGGSIDSQAKGERDGN